jgi:hypothetical protein
MSNIGEKLYHCPGSAARKNHGAVVLASAASSKPAEANITAPRDERVRDVAGHD